MKIRNQLLLLTCWVAVCIAVVVAASVWGLAAQQSRMLDLSERQFTANLLALKARAEAAEVHSFVYRLISWVDNLDAAKLKTQQTELNHQLNAAQTTLDGLRLKVDASLHEPLALAASTQAAYRKMALDAVDLASVDPNTGTAAMQTADQTYRKLSTQLDNIVISQGEQVSAANLRAARSEQTIFWALIGVGLCAVFFTVCAALLFTRNLVRQLGAEPGEAAALAQRVAAGDLSMRIDLSENNPSSLMAQLSAMQKSLANVVHGVRQNAQGVAAASAQIAQGNTDLSRRTESQSGALEQTAASMERLSATVKQNAENARQANQFAQGASTVANKGGVVVEQVVETMKGIHDSSKKIADIISVIDGIAFQTNILALNAAVEAARAGEQGRGFAVVASEVRRLAGRSAEAAKEIKDLITASVEQVQKGANLVDTAGATMIEVVGSINQVTGIMAEITAASVDQSAGVAQVGAAVNLMDQATQQNAALVEQSAIAAENLKTQSQQLVGAVGVFKLALDSAVPYAQQEKAIEIETTDRRGPHRAKNVSRLPVNPRSGAARVNEVHSPETAKTGTDDWAQF